MVERVGVEVEPRDAAGEGALDGAVEQPRADAPADVGRASGRRRRARRRPVRNSRPGRHRDGRHAARGPAGRAASAERHRTAAGARTTARDGRRDRRARDRTRRSASGRARSTRRSPERRPRSVQSARTISRCVMVIGSRPSARGGGWWANNVCMAVRLVYQQAAGVQAIKKAALAATNLRLSCQLSYAGRSAVGESAVPRTSCGRRR